MDRQWLLLSGYHSQSSFILLVYTYPQKLFLHSIVCSIIILTVVSHVMVFAVVYCFYIIPLYRVQTMLVSGYVTQTQSLVNLWKKRIMVGIAEYTIGINQTIHGTMSSSVFNVLHILPIFYNLWVRLFVCSRMYMSYMC